VLWDIYPAGEDPIPGVTVDAFAATIQAAGGPAPVVLRPRVPHRQPVLVGLSGRFTEQRELANNAGAAPLEVLLQTGVGHHQLAVVEDIVADQAVDVDTWRTVMVAPGTAAAC
jgi:hypothetical protein